MSMVWSISISQLGLAAWLCSLPAPAHLPVSWIRETAKSPWFHSSNWKHQCYQHSSCPKSKTQQLLRGKLTLSQPKPGQMETTQPLWTNCSSAWLVKKFILMSSWSVSCFNLSFCVSFFCHAVLRRAWLHLLCYLLTDTDKLPLHPLKATSSPGWTSPLPSASVHPACALALDHLGGPSVNSLWFINILLILGGQRLDAVF